MTQLKNQEIAFTSLTFRYATLGTDAPVKEPPAPVKPSETPPSKAPVTPAPEPTVRPGEAPLPCPGPCKF